MMKGLAGMADSAFLDTNVLVYMYDRHAPAKQAIARSLVGSGIERGILVLSVQVLGEFFSAVTRRIPNPLSADEAEQEVNRIAVLPVIGIDSALVRRGIDTHKRYRIAYWDALIVVAAERAGCTQIFSEDLNPGQSYNDIVVRNPF